MIPCMISSFPIVKAFINIFRLFFTLDFPKEPTPSHSIFPMENYDLLYTKWEDDIIWDSENMDHIPGMIRKCAESRISKINME